MADREFPAIGPDPYFVFPEPIRHPRPRSATFASDVLRVTPSPSGKGPG